MRRSALILAVASLAGAGVVWAVYDLHGALVMLALLIATGAATLAVAHLVAARRRSIGSLSRQFDVAGAVAVGQLLLVAAVVAAFMFLTSHDALMMAVVVAVAGVVAARAASLFAGGVLRDVEAVRDGLVAVGAGDRTAAIATGGRDEVAELAAAANAMTERLAAEEAARDAADGARRNLVAAVSHDLRTPITSLRLLAEALDDDIVDEETRRRYVATMGTHVRALGALVDDLFELSRLEAGEITWSVQRVALDGLVGDTVEAMRPEAEASGVAVRAEIPPGIAPAAANPEKLQRVLFNLIQNAIRHTPADGSVTVRAQVEEGAVRIEVADTGGGVDAADRERIFDPFFRGGADAPRTRAGAGLGLAISRAIVEAHGGRIWLADADRGTLVRFTVPAAT